MKCIQYMNPLIFGTLLLTGCSSIYTRIDALEACARHKCQAQQAWNEQSWYYEKLDHPFHFAKGFKTAYRDVIEGGNGCQPTLPPKCYWTSRFQSAKGRCKVNEWFDGYSHGALAAQQDDVGAWAEIPLSPTARTNMRTAAARAYSSGKISHVTSPPPIAVPARTAVPPAHPSANGYLRLHDQADSAGTYTEEQTDPLRPFE